MAKEKQKNKPPIKQKYVDTPENLLKLWDEYKSYIDSSPDVQEIATGKGVHSISVKKPYLRQGFESYVYRKHGFHIHQYIDNYGEQYNSYLGVVTCIRGEWQQDQIEGTLTGRYKAPNLVARINGLSDAQKQEQSGTVNVIYQRADTAK
jgi:hypothetical protein